MNGITWIRRFTIMTRLTALVGAVLVALLLVGVAGWLGMKEVRSLSQDYLDRSVSASAQLLALRTKLAIVRGLEKDMVINYEKSDEVTRAKRTWATTRDALRSDVDLMVARSSGERADAAKELQRQLEEYSASFTPIILQLEARAYDNAAVVVRIMKRARDAADAAERLIDDLSSLQAKEAEVGKASVEATVRTSLLAFIGILVVAIAVVVPLTLLSMRSICAPMNDATKLAHSIAGGDLAKTVDAQGRDETADMMRALSGMQQWLHSIVSQVRSATQDISYASSEIAIGNQDLSNRTERTASNLQTAASAITQLASTVRMSAESAQHADRLATSTADVAEKGGVVVKDVVDTMGHIDAASKKVQEIIGVIDAIAFQTNILALNAAVEAARAGEQGRGFAVVAEEVRTLARRSAKAASEIKVLIAESVARVAEGSAQVQLAGRTMQEIVSSVKSVSELIGEISNASVEQAGGVEQVSVSLRDLDQMTQQNSALVEESAAAAESLRDQARRLAEMVAEFRLNGTEGEGAPGRTAAPTLANESAIAVVSRGDSPTVCSANLQREAAVAL